MRIQAEPIIDIQFVSLAGLVILKLISWNDNQVRRRKDAYDLSLIMRTYLDARNLERLYDQEVDLAEGDFDYVRAGSRLLDRDIAKILGPDIREMIVNILIKETGEQTLYRLVEDMLDMGSESGDFENALQLINDLKTGILDVRRLT